MADVHWEREKEKERERERRKRERGREKEIERGNVTPIIFSPSRESLYSL